MSILALKVLVSSLINTLLDTFGPKRIWSPDISSSTIGPQLIGPSGQMVPNQFSSHGQMVPNNLFPRYKWSPTNLVPMDKWSPTNLVSLEKWSLEYFVCPGGQTVDIWKYGDKIGWGPFVQEVQIFGDHLSMGTEFDGDCLSRGINFMVTICPGGSGGPEVRGSNGSGPNVSQPTPGVRSL